MTIPIDKVSQIVHRATFTAYHEFDQGVAVFDTCTFRIAEAAINIAIKPHARGLYRYSILTTCVMAKKAISKVGDIGQVLV
jgi:hypothetical protein